MNETDRVISLHCPRCGKAMQLSIAPECGNDEAQILSRMSEPSAINLLWHRRFTEGVAFILEPEFRLLMAALFEAHLAEHPFDTKLREALKPKMTVSDDGIASIPVEGILAYRPDPYEMAFFGVEDSRNVLGMVNAAAFDKSVKGIQLNIDSPGGMMTGGFEIADAVASASRMKPTIAHIGGYGASLAYLIASQAREVVANRTAMVGSIGAYRMSVDRTAAHEKAGLKVKVFRNKEGDLKAPGLAGTAMSNDQEKNISDSVQDSFDEFASMVKKARPAIKSDAMRGQVFTGKQGREVGLVDRRQQKLKELADKHPEVRERIKKFHATTK